MGAKKYKRRTYSLNRTTVEYTYDMIKGSEG